MSRVLYPLEILLLTDVLFQLPPFVRYWDAVKPLYFSVTVNCEPAVMTELSGFASSYVPSSFCLKKDTALVFPESADSCVLEYVMSPSVAGMKASRNVSVVFASSFHTSIDGHV